MAYHPDDLISAARNVPAVSAGEVANWRIRNACEVAVLVKLGFVDARVLDDIARKEDHALGAPHLTAELASWRELCGLDALEIQSEDVQRPSHQLPHGFSACAQMLEDLGRACLNEGDKHADGAPLPIGVHGPDAIRREAAWRPTNSGTSAWKAIAIEGVPTKMLRRSWFTTPDDGPIIVTPSASMASNQLDIWWGLHNGAHLDLLSALGPSSLCQLEMGPGLLLSEALAMSLEILAALETKAGRARYCLRVLGKGFIERADRLAGVIINITPYRTMAFPSQFTGRRFPGLPKPT